MRRRLARAGTSNVNPGAIWQARRVRSFCGVEWGVGGMECGSSDLLCQFMTLVADNELPAGAIVAIVAHLGEKAAGIWGQVAAFFKEYGQTAVGLAGFVFGLARWWRYREAILHKRLAKYLADNDERLLGGQRYVLEALRRPSPGQLFKDPLFVGPELRAVLRERNWDRSPIAYSVERSADLQLEKAGERVRKQLEIAKRSRSSLNEELATTYILRGAIAASQARRSPQQSLEQNNLALLWFKTALLVPEHENNPTAKEYQAHALRKLGYYEQARLTYEELAAQLELQSPSKDEQRRENVLALARAKRYRAEAYQALAFSAEPDGTRVFNGTLNAFNLLNPATEGSALKLRAPLAPFQSWDLLEQGDIHYFTAFVAHNLGFGQVRQTQLVAAQTAYQGVLAGLRVRWIWTPLAEKELRRLANEGEARVTRASNNGDYDTDWLIPSK